MVAQFAMTEQLNICAYVQLHWVRLMRFTAFSTSYSLFVNTYLAYYWSYSRKFVSTPYLNDLVADA